MHKSLLAGVASCALAAQLSATAADNPLGRNGVPFSSTAAVEGHWNGVDIEQRSNCAASQNNGTHGTYAEFSVSTSAPPLPVFAIAQTGITGLNCNYRGDYRVVDGVRSAEGTYSCSDGKQGTFRTRSLQASNETLSVRMDIVLSGAETCTIDALIGAARLNP